MATLTEELRKVHLGRRLDGDSIEFSSETHRLDTAAIASAVKDIVRSSMSRHKLESQVSAIERAMREKIDFRQALEGLPRAGLLKKEVEAVRDVMERPGTALTHRRRSAVAILGTATNARSSPP
jgi:hypothetical protein